MHLPQLPKFKFRISFLNFDFGKSSLFLFGVELHGLNVCITKRLWQGDKALELAVIYVEDCLSCYVFGILMGLKHMGERNYMHVDRWLAVI